MGLTSELGVADVTVPGVLEAAGLAVPPGAEQAIVETLRTTAISARLKSLVSNFIILRYLEKFKMMGIKKGIKSAQPTHIQVKTFATVEGSSGSRRICLTLNFPPQFGHSVAARDSGSNTILEPHSVQSAILSEPLDASVLLSIVGDGFILGNRFSDDFGSPSTFEGV